MQMNWLGTEKLLVEVQDLRKSYPSASRNLWNIPGISKRKAKRSQHVTHWTWKHEDL